MEDYSDIINLPHHISKNRKRMSNYERAAQFAPFSPLSGYDTSILEAGRFTDRKIELSQEEIDTINRKLCYLKNHLKEKIEITVEYFVPDQNKKGGRYIITTAVLKKISENEQRIILSDEREILMADILKLEFCGSEKL